MVKFIKPGKVVIVLQGRQAGKKAVVIKNVDEGTKERPYPHAIVAGIERYPRKVTKRMSAKKVALRSHVKPFIQAVNYNHLMPTRYGLELEDLKDSVDATKLKDPSQKQAAKKSLKASFEKRYTAGKNRWFFTKLRF
ncbi:60S ribosomal protein L27B [Dimargaris cristalligena]|uniref:60S ribosomal protein L27 n=1 Tax=Dimargaris cristalligena TaxID=215637 RepID=A0A4Q0A1H3_9FUNG|nr:60S ribosomal protein L27B [Dimargaris cristalligena]RKP39000.1 ribosomal L27e protein family-domain-containing protein [Dimargaris cristalligena]|eukprot:RKP39000.1 ribosomal L27e protein family-domain-containing protein [Dimargaris cristalligena]